MANEINETISFIAAVKIAVIVMSVKSFIRIGLKKESYKIYAIIKYNMNIITLFQPLSLITFNSLFRTKLLNFRLTSSLCPKGTS